MTSTWKYSSGALHIKHSSFISGVFLSTKLHLYLNNHNTISDIILFTALINHNQVYVNQESLVFLPVKMTYQNNEYLCTAMATSRIYRALHLDMSTFASDRICYIILPEKLKESKILPALQLYSKD